MPILEVHNLEKHYKTVVAVRDVSFQVMQGCCFGLLGPNGAGKTTTMEMVENIIEPTGGTILYRGKPRSDAFRQEIGIQFQHTSLLNFLTVRETLACYQQLYQNPEDSDWLIERCNLGPLLRQRNDQLSGGQYQRLMLALALVNRPELIFLDEPSTGLDPQSRRYLWEIINDIRTSGKTIIMTTHSMEEAQHLCDIIAIMDNGEIIAEGSPARLIAEHCRTSTIALPLPRQTEGLDELGVEWQAANGSLVIRTDHVERMLPRLVDSGIDLSEMRIQSPTLEDVFLALTGKQLRD